MFPPSQVSHNGTATAAGNNSAQNDVLMRENARLRNELEVYVEKAARLQKVSWLAAEETFSCLFPRDGQISHGF